MVSENHSKGDFNFMSETKNQATEVANVKKEFNLMADAEAIKSAMSEDIFDLNISLNRYKLPTGGSTLFEIETGDGEAESVKELRGVIVYHHPAYSYYKDSFNGENKLPDCYSNDGQIGCGVPGGKCKECSLNKFESGVNGVGKACKNKRALYIALEGQLFPVVMLLPTGSLQSFTKYVQANLFKQRKLSNIITRISLKKATNKQGIAFSQAVFTFERALTDSEKTKLAGLSDFVKEYARNHVPQSEPNDDIPFTEVENTVNQ